MAGAPPAAAPLRDCSIRAMTRGCARLPQSSRGEKGLVTAAGSSPGGCGGCRFNASSSLLSQNSCYFCLGKQTLGADESKNRAPAFIGRDVQKEYANWSVSRDKRQQRKQSQARREEAENMEGNMQSKCDHVHFNRSSFYYCHFYAFIV